MVHLTTICSTGFCVHRTSCHRTISLIAQDEKHNHKI